MRPRKIESPRNPAVKRAVEARERRLGGGEFMVEGPHLVESALEAGAEIGQAFVAERFKAPRGLPGRLARSGAEVFEITERVLHKLSGTEAPQGILAVVSLEPAGLGSIRESAGPVVVLDGVGDPGNAGTIIRTADAAGASAVIVLEGTCDPFGQKALRASSGSIFNIPVVHAGRKTVAEELRGKGMRIVATTLDAGLSVFEAELGGKVALVFGSETKGVSPELRRAADISVRIPLRGRAESLNVASAAAVVLYEAVRQSRK
ncbi:MAG: RNA methyltransferase [Nitrospirota bacterium]